MWWSKKRLAMYQLFLLKQVLYAGIIRNFTNLNFLNTDILKLKVSVKVIIFLLNTTIK